MRIRLVARLESPGARRSWRILGQGAVKGIPPTGPTFSRKPAKKKNASSLRLFLVPVKGGRDYIIPQLAVYIPLIYHLYTTYILPSGGLYNPYHLLGEPETAIDQGV